MAGTDKIAHKSLGGPRGKLGALCGKMGTGGNATAARIDFRCEAGVRLLATEDTESTEFTRSPQPPVFSFFSVARDGPIKR